MGRKQKTEQNSPTHQKLNTSRLPTTYHSIFFPFISVTFVLIYHITRRKPIHRGIKYWHHHAAGQSLLFAKAIQITVADLWQKRFIKHTHQQSLPETLRGTLTYFRQNVPHCCHVCFTTQFSYLLTTRKEFWTPKYSPSFSVNVSEYKMQSTRINVFNYANLWINQKKV